MHANKDDISLNGSRPVSGRGGYRPGAGRPRKTDKHRWGRVSCILRHETIEALRDGAGSFNVGEFLQFHLDHYPLPSRYQYETLSQKEADGTVLRTAFSYSHVPEPRPRKRIRSIRRRTKFSDQLMLRLKARGLDKINDANRKALTSTPLASRAAS